MGMREETARAGPGEEYNPGPPTPPRQAATVILLRGGAEDLEVLLVRRTPQARFMGGVWVFPGGAVDAVEGDGDEAHRAAAVRELVALGINPVEAKRSARAPKPSKKTFGQCALAVIKKKQGESRNEKHRRQWRMTLETYAAPLWGLPVDQVDTEAVLAVLQPLWQSIPETASRLRGRIEAALSVAYGAGRRAYRPQRG